MSRLLEQLQQGDAQGFASRVNLAELCREVAAEWSERGAAPTFEDHDTELYLRASRERLVSVLGHIVRNAQDAVGRDGNVVVRLSESDGNAIIEVADNGPGMEEEFVRNRLFRPFESTKGSKGMGIGAYQAREFARGLGGDAEVYSIIGEGTRFRLVLPLDADETALSSQQSGAMS
ncbi:MAG: hypothetical protein HKN49_08655 [Gammaproteobacteria bacterium]|nr:hypothetical protein [Gammaproteobacteria bacterium]